MVVEDIRELVEFRFVEGRLTSIKGNECIRSLM